MMIMGGRAVPRMATRVPGRPHMRYPRITEALMGMGPGEDWAMAVMSSISSSSSQPSSSTNFFFIRDTMTNPPPKVKALSKKVALNSCHKMAALLSVRFIGKSLLLVWWPYYTTVFS